LTQTRNPSLTPAKPSPVLEDWFASEEKIKIFNDPAELNTAHELRFSEKFLRRCNELLACKGMKDLVNRIFESYCLKDRFDQNAFESDFSCLVKLGAKIKSKIKVVLSNKSNDPQDR